MSNEFSFGVVILGAGASSRMGKSKLLLPWRDTTFIGSILRQWQELGAKQIGVVLRADDADLTTELDRILHSPSHRIINPDAARGMFSSVQCAAHWSNWFPDLTHIVITLGDQPHLSTQSLAQLLSLARTDRERISQPSRDGYPAHPIVLPRETFAELKIATQHTLKEFLADHRDEVRLVEINDPGLELDIDTPEEYRVVRERFGG